MPNPDRITDLPPGHVDVPISASGPTQKLIPQKDGTTKIVPGKAHEAQEGKVLHPGVRTVSSAGSGPTCPNCARSGTLKVHMNKPVGRRIYCTECGYDQDKQGATSGGVNRLSARSEPSAEIGVKVIRQRGPRG